MVFREFVSDFVVSKNAGESNQLSCEGASEFQKRLLIIEPIIDKLKNHKCSQSSGKLVGSKSKNLN